MPGNIAWIVPKSDRLFPAEAAPLENQGQLELPALSVAFAP